MAIIPTSHGRDRRVRGGTDLIAMASRTSMESGSSSRHVSDTLCSGNISISSHEEGKEISNVPS